MNKITVNASKTYDIYIGNGILSSCGSISSRVLKGRRALIVSDDNVAPLYLRAVRQSLEYSGFKTESFVFPHGERSKNIKTYSDILNFMAEKHFTRSDSVFALGGGVTGDMAGFCAASYMRGIDFVQIPTSLLADVDSSVGGKTAIDLDYGKNLVGAFHQPSFVLCDTDALDTLPDEFFSDGMAEVIKYAMIRSASLFELLKTGAQNRIEEVISECVEIKKDIVNRDERETGERKLLNFGHTLGHAAELLSGFKIHHGHAVAIGMQLMTNAFEKTGICEKGTSERLRDLLSKYLLPHKSPFDAESLYNAALSDKKRSGDSVSIIIPKKIGDCDILTLSLGEFKKVVELGVEN